MDDQWERSIPLFNIGMVEAKDLFAAYDKRIEIIELTPIHTGCRNSNYKVRTNQGNYLLRICPSDDVSYRKEQAVSEIFHGRIRIPEVLHLSDHNSTQRACLIYEYIDGTSMQELINQQGRLDDQFLIQVAESASYIHNHKVEDRDEFADNYPPFTTWYDLFLDDDLVTARLGTDMKARVKKLIEHKQDSLQVIESYVSFIHSDFRPANMVVDTQTQVWIVDWEFAGFGHSLADLGQFFRYAHCFGRQQVHKFAEVYNYYSNRPLPDDWYELSKLRDLVNPLQMLGARGDLPQKFADLKNIVRDTLEFFEH